MPQIGIAGLGSGRLGVQRVRHAVRRFPAIREQDVVGDAEQVGPEGPAPLVARRTVQNGDEGVLRQLLGPSGVGRAAAEEGPDRLPVAPEQRLERRPRAPPHLVHQVFVAGHICRPSEG